MKKQLTLLDKTNGKICITPIKGLQLIFEKKMVNLQISPVFYSMQLHGTLSIHPGPRTGLPGRTDVSILINSTVAIAMICRRCLAWGPGDERGGTRVGVSTTVATSTNFKHISNNGTSLMSTFKVRARFDHKRFCGLETERCTCHQALMNACFTFYLHFSLFFSVCLKRLAKRYVIKTCNDGGIHP